MSPSPSRPRILVVVDHFLPGEKAGGPVRSIANLIAHLHDAAEFLVLTQDRDLGDSAPYPCVHADEWMKVAGASVRYLAAAGWQLGAVIRAVRRTPHDVLYLNSYFSPSTQYLLAARRLGLLRRSPRVVVAPRGQYGAGALALKRRKKFWNLAVANATGVHTGLVWHATTPDEARVIRERIRPSGRVIVAANLSAAKEPTTAHSAVAGPEPHSAAPPAVAKRPGVLHVVTVARVNRMKNQSQAIALLADLPGELTFDVYGSLEDDAYLEECRALARRDGTAARVRFLGPLRHAQVAATLARYHLFFLPSLGENFGHAVYEALAAGCPVLISDRTPWRGLAERAAGWDLPLESPDSYRRVLASCVAMDAPEHERLSRGARALAHDTAVASVGPACAAYLTLFQLPDVH